MDVASNTWEKLGAYFEHRPAQVIGVIVGAVVFIGLLGYSSVTSSSNAAKLERVQAAFCNADKPYTADQQENCKKLMDRLLKDPTPEQARRLREIVESQ